MKHSLSRYKPVGWRGDSHRHYLAAKGIKTKISPHRYFVRDELKGNRGFSNIHRAFAKGHSVNDLQSDAQLRQAFGVELSELQAFKGKKSPASRLPEGIGGDVSSTNYSEFSEESYAPLPEAQLPVAEVPEDIQEVPQEPIEYSESGDPSVEASGEVVMTPGVPSRSTLQFGSGTVLE